MPSHDNYHGSFSIENNAIQHAENIKLQHVAESLEHDKSRVSDLYEQAARYKARSTVLDRDLVRLRAQVEELSVEVSTLSGRIAQEYETLAQLHKMEVELEKEHKQNTAKLQEFEAACQERNSEKERMMARVAREQRAWNKGLMVVEKKARELLKSPIGVTKLKERKLRAWGKREEVRGRVETIHRELEEVNRAWEAEQETKRQEQQQEQQQWRLEGEDEGEEEEEEEEEVRTGVGGGGKERQHWRELGRLQELQRVLREEGAVLDRKITVARGQIQAAEMAEDGKNAREELLEKEFGGGEGKETRGTGFGASRGPESDVSSLGSPSIYSAQEVKEGEEMEEGGGNSGGGDSVEGRASCGLQR
ncbi:Hypothetical protein NocV09_03600430 [Nannochloropsis oceanica]